MLVDFHNHIDLYQDYASVVSRCDNLGIYVLCVTTTPNSWNGTNKILSTSAKIKPALGFHPQLASSRIKELETFEKYLPMAKYIGEVGLDGTLENKKNLADQLKVFKHILYCVNAAGGRIMSIHSKQASQLVLDEIRNISCTPVLHWFSGDKYSLTTAIDMGCWFSVGPAMLRSKSGRERVSLMPKDKIITETDGPFAQNRNIPLYPWDINLTFEPLSQIWGTDIVETKSIIAENFRALLR